MPLKREPTFTLPPAPNRRLVRGRSPESCPAEEPAEGQADDEPEAGGVEAHEASFRCELLQARHWTVPVSWSRVRLTVVPHTEHQGWRRRAEMDSLFHEPWYWTRV